MDYSRIYSLLVNRAKNRLLDGYSEKHHIIPKCMGGSESPDNIVELTAREHYLAHWMLAKWHKTYKLIFAWRSMAMNPLGKRYTSHSFKYGKEAWAREMADRNRGVKFSPEHIKNLSDSHLGQEAWNKGMVTGETVGRKVRLLQYMDNPQRCITCESPIPYRFKSRSRKYCCKACQFVDPNRVIGAFNKNPNAGSFKKGHTLKYETVKKISDKLTGMKRPRGTCPHCNTEGALSLLKRWHFDNCKKR